MSFGFSIGDFIAVGELAVKVVKAVKEAPKAFQNIDNELSSFIVVLKEVEENVKERSLSPQQEEGLKVILHGCKDVLLELQGLHQRYKGLSGGKRWLDRIDFASKDIASLRARVTSNSSLLANFMNILPATIEPKLDDFLRLLNQQQNGSIATERTFDSLSTCGKASWRMVRKDLESVGLSIEAFEANRDFILDWFTRAYESGHLDLEIENGDDAEHPNESMILDLATNALIDGSHGEHQDTGSTHESPSLETQTLSSQTTATNNLKKTALLTTVIKPKAPKSSAITNTIPFSDILSNFVTRQRARLIAEAEKGDFHEVSKILTGRSAAKTIPPKTRDIALMHACYKSCNKPTVTALLESGANVNAQFDTGIMVTHAGLRMTQGNFKGCTALMIAAYKGADDIVQLLLQRGASLECTLVRACPVGEMTDRVVPTPLAFAVRSGSLRTVQTVLSAGAILDQRVDTYTALHQACRGWHLEPVQELLDKGMPIDDDSREGSPLMIALIERSWDAAEFLMAKGADVNYLKEKPTPKGHRSPMEVAIWIAKKVEKKKLGLAELASDVTMVWLLRKKGASMTVAQSRQLEAWQKMLRPHQAFADLMQKAQKHQAFAGLMHEAQRSSD